MSLSLSPICNDLMNINTTVQVLKSLCKSLMYHTTTDCTIIWEFFSLHKDRSNQLIDHDCLLDVSFAMGSYGHRESETLPLFHFRIFTSNGTHYTHNWELIHSSEHRKKHWMFLLRIQLGLIQYQASFWYTQQMLFYLNQWLNVNKT